MALSDLTVRQARTTGKRYTLSDNDCLGLMVSAAGGKSWIFRYYWLGKQKRMSLGGYPALSLREARAERDKAQALLARGIDPQIERDQRRHAARLAGEYTFKNVFDAWVEHRRKELKEGRQSTLSQILRIFNKDACVAYTLACRITTVRNRHRRIAATAYGSAIRRWQCECRERSRNAENHAY